MERQVGTLSCLIRQVPPYLELRLQKTYPVVSGWLVPMIQWEKFFLPHEQSPPGVFSDFNDWTVGSGDQFLVAQFFRTSVERSASQIDLTCTHRESRQALAVNLTFRPSGEIKVSSWVAALRPPESYPHYQFWGMCLEKAAAQQPR